MDILTGHDVLVDDLDVIVSVRSGVFVPKADHVTEFMDDNPELVAVLPDGDGLGTVPALPDEGTATGFN